MDSSNLKPEAKQAIRKVIDDSGLAPNCITCEWWEEGKCGKWGAVPPPQTIAYGCPDYLQIIPF